MEEDVVKFLSRFVSSESVIETFTCGCCYWFAMILASRFTESKPELMYDQIGNHFGAKIGDKVYDITGDVTSEYEWEKWADLDDPSLKKRIIRDCIMF